MDNSEYDFDSATNLRSLDDDDMSQQVALILDSLDRFTFSSGKSITLSSVKKKKPSIQGSRSLPRPRRVAFKDENENGNESNKISTSDFGFNDNSRDNTRREGTMNSIPMTEKQSAPTKSQLDIAVSNENLASSGIGQSILEDDDGTCLPLHLKSTQQSKEAILRSEVVSHKNNESSRDATKKNITDCDLSMNLEEVEFRMIQDVWSERERVRTWFNEVRQTVQTWVHENQLLLDLKSKQSEQAATDSNAALHRYQSEINDANQKIDNLRLEISRTLEHHQLVEKNLHEIIQNLQLQLEHEVGVKEMVNELLESSTTSIPVDNRHPFDIIENSILKERNTASSTTENEQLVGESPQNHEAILTPSTSIRSSKWNNPTPKISPDSSAPDNVVKNDSLTMNATDGDVTSLIRRKRRQTRHVSEDGSVVEVVQYGNGSRKEVHPDGLNVIWFPNGDIQASSRDTSVAYYYANKAVIEIRHPDGSKEYEFPSGQKERHFVDGTKVIAFPSGFIGIRENDIVVNIDDSRNMGSDE